MMTNPEAACQVCGGWTSYGGMSQHSSCVCQTKKAEIASLKEQIAYNEKRIDFLVGYEDLGCDGTLQELESCRNWLRTYQDELKDLES